MRTTTSSLAALTIVVGLGVSIDARAAEPTPPPAGLEGTVWLDARAPVFAAIHPTDLGDGFALMDLIGGIFPETMRTLNRVRDGLGLYAFSRSEFSESGVDPDALVVASWGIADEGDWSKADKQAGKKSKPVFVRHRFVIKALDGEKLVRATVAVLAGANISVANFARTHGDPSIPAWASEGDLKSIARRSGIQVLGRARDGALVSLRRAGDYAIIDYADPWGPSPAEGSKPEVAATLAKMVAPVKQPLSNALAQGTRKLLSTEDVSIALVIEPAALAPLFSRASCRRDWVGGEGALFDDAAVLLRLHPFQWRLEVAWALTALGKAKLGGVASDDGVLDARAAAADGIAAAGLLVDSFDAIRGAPRPPVLGGKPERVMDSLAACGPLSWVQVVARFWPQLAASQLERVTASVSGASGSAALLGNLRNVGAVIRHLPEKNQTWEGSTVLLGSLPGTAEGGVTDLLSTQASGKPETQTFGGRTPTFFDLSAGTGFSEAGLEHIAAGHLSLALTPQASGLGWYYRLARRPAKFGPQANIGYLHVNLARLLESWSEESDQGTRAAVRLAAGQLGQLGGNLSLDGDLVRLALDLSGTE
jgi:hypothetical protein